MALIQVYQSDSKTLYLQFADDGGTPLNVSGFLVRGVARANYVSSGIIDKTVTGAAPAALTGLVLFPLTTGDTNQCPNDYLLFFRVSDLSSGSSTYPTDGLRILPTTVP